MPSNSTMRVRSRSRCSSRVWRPCAIKSSSVASTVRCKVRCTVATSLTDSAIMRVSSWTRVKRSNSSGSKPACASLACARRDCIWDSACNSISRNCWRKRLRLPVMSLRDPRSWPISASSRERVIMTSPAWLTMRSSNCERTRTEAVAAWRKGCIAIVKGAGTRIFGVWPSSSEGTGSRLCRPRSSSGAGSASSAFTGNRPAMRSVAVESKAGCALSVSA